VDDLRQLQEVRGLSDLDDLPDRPVGDANRGDRLRLASCVDVHHLLAIAAEEEAQPISRGNGVGHDTDGGALDLLEQQHGVAAVCLEAAQQPGQLEVRIDLGRDLRELARREGFELVQERAEVLGHVLRSRVMFGSTLRQLRTRLIANPVNRGQPPGRGPVPPGVRPESRD
jgi:hypothetical protein